MNEQERFSLASYRIKRAKETLKEVELHIENELWITAINRLYYACFYAVTALLINNQIKTHTHSGTRQMFSLHFIKKGIIPSELGKFYADIFDMRQTGDYDDFVEYSESDVIEALEPAKELINKIDILLNT